MEILSSKSGVLYSGPRVELREAGIRKVGQLELPATYARLDDTTPEKLTQAFDNVDRAHHFGQTAPVFTDALARHYATIARREQLKQDAAAARQLMKEIRT